MPKGLDLIGGKFGKLTVVSMVKTRNGRSWICKCDCGKTKEKPVSGYELKSGIRTTCGCGNTSMLNRLTHGKSNSRLYRIWNHMKQRCSNRKNKYYHNYGGRGITVCSEWVNFEVFQAWAISNGYGDNLTIERVDNNGNYCPDNCTWIQKSAQSSNTRRCVTLTYNGKTQNISSWAKELGLPYTLLQARKKRGWDDVRILSAPATMPCFARGKRLTFCGITKSGSGWARKLGISVSAIHRRLKKYGTIEAVIKNSDAILFKRMVEAATGIPTTVEG